MEINRSQTVSGTISAAVRELRDRNRILFAVAVINLALAVLYTGLMAVDTRMLLGRNVWTKPWKFATSIVIFTATIGWILPSLSLSDRRERLAAATIGGAMMIEITLISTQAARGVASHFNSATPLDMIIFLIMGVTITISTLVVAYVLWRIIRDPPNLSASYLWGVRLGMFLFVIASFEGWLMISQGAHTVGVPNDSPGIPLLNWSVTGGDLRIAHFIGLHSLQILPLTGYVAAQTDYISSRGSLGIVGLVGVLYSGLIGGTFLIALMGNPLVSSLPVPQSPALLAGGLLVVTVISAAGLTKTIERFYGLRGDSLAPFDQEADSSPEGDD